MNVIFKFKLRFVRFINFIFFTVFTLFFMHHVWDVFRVLSGRTFVFGLHTKKVKNFFKTLKSKT